MNVQPGKSQYPPPMEQSERHDGTGAVAECCYRTRGERLAYLRARAGLTIQAAAQRTGISTSELSRIENDRRRLTRNHIARIAEAYGLIATALEEILDFTPVKELVRYSVVDPSPRGSDGVIRIDVPCYLSSAITGVGLSVGHNDTVKLPDGIAAGRLGYSVCLTVGDGGYFFQPDTLLVINPQARVVLGDLVINTSTWSPILVSLARNSTGRLVGRCLDDNISFSESTLLTSFHKVVAVLPP